MHQIKERKDFLSMKEFQEGADNWLREHNWSLDINWNECDHKACQKPLRGRWKVVGYGWYTRTLGIGTWFFSVRCGACGQMVQWSQDYDEVSQASQPVRRNVFVP